MFTGLVEEVGEVQQIKKQASGILLRVRSGVCGEDIKIGDSLSVNGCCLTVISKKRIARKWDLEMDLLEETWEKTSFESLRKGSGVNLERALRADGRLGGHFVTGHVDGVGVIAKLVSQAGDHLMEIRVPPSLQPFFVYKGSVAVEGVSLTVAEVLKRSIRLWLIPHTMGATNFSGKKEGDRVNLETDILGKYVARFMQHPAGL